MTAYIKTLAHILTSRRRRYSEKSKKRRWYGLWVPNWAAHGPDQALEKVQVGVYLPRKSFRSLIWILALMFVTWGAVHEFNTSGLQARILSSYAEKLVYQVKQGPSQRIVFPTDGPFDVRRGYTSLPEFARRLLQEGFVVQEQAAFSGDLAGIAAWGITPPYREPSVAGLKITDVNGVPLYDATAGNHLLADYDSIPPIMIRSILYMENRELGEESGGLESNPVIDWPRLIKAAATFAGSKLKLPVRLQGGSTLATQIEKYRHSPAGRTDSGIEKLKQMLSASLRVYREGRNTQRAREEIVQDYLNSVPLAAVAGYGEVNGLGNGLFAWFGMDLDKVCRDLNDPRPSMAKARALKYVLTLLAAIRAPNYYLNQHRDELEARVRFYSESMEKQGIIDHELGAKLNRIPIIFTPHLKKATDDFSPDMKAVSSLRIHLSGLLGVPSLYDLAQIHLDVDTTLNAGIQKDVARVLKQLRNPDFVSSNGLYGSRLLLPGSDLDKVTYSFLLYESRPEGNVLRAQVDNLDAPFDINEGVKLQLGSTAKLRVLANYLELAAGLYRDFSVLDSALLVQKVQQARDPITLWAVEILRLNPGLSLDSFLEKAMERRYSASPYETFFTGGGEQKFRNFDSADNGRILTIREATQRSVNLVFIRLMKDIVRYYEARLPYDPDEVMKNIDDPVRIRLLQEIAEDEARDRLSDFYQTYRSLTQDAAAAAILGSHAGSQRRLAMLFFAWHPESRTRDPELRLSNWLQARKAAATPEQVKNLVRAYGNPRLTIADYGYLLGRHPLEVWSAGQLACNPGLSWDELLKSSVSARKVSSAWLFKTRNRAAQDVRLRIRFEQDAFERMTPVWRRLGFPFEHLVPSLATAIGSSSDRPAALAELMGIIVNDGVRRPMMRFEDLRFAQGTPYETDFRHAPAKTGRVMPEPVARLLRLVLSEVVEKGTAIRAAGAFTGLDGKPVVIGGKTGSGDNRLVEMGRGGVRLSSQAVNRTATFVFYAGSRYFGVITAFVDGQAAAGYQFTSSLPLAVLKVLAPAIQPYLFPTSEASQSHSPAVDTLRQRAH